MQAVTIRPLLAEQVEAEIAALSELLIDCVEGGASVSFMAPIAWEHAESFWRGVAVRVAEGTTDLLIAELGGAVVGTVQLVAAVPENQPHRADVAKMLVLRRARRQGVGRALMRAVEQLAAAKGKTLLVLDTVSGAAGARLYESVGWVSVGTIPNYALFPDGRPCDTTIFYRALLPA